MFENLNELCIGELSSVLYRQYQSYINQNMKNHGVNFSECAYLIKIPDRGIVTQSYIAERLFCDNAVVTRSLQRLENKGFVKRHKSADDKRTVMVSLTAKGMEIKQIGMDARKRWKELVMSETSADEEKLLIQTLKSMAKKALFAAHNKGTEEVL